MITCKQVARALAERDYAELSRLKRISLRLHVLLCFVCGRYHRYLMRFQDGVRRYREGEASRASPPDPQFCLRSEDRAAIRSALESEARRVDDDGTRS